MSQELAATIRQMLADWNAATPEQRMTALASAARAASEKVRVDALQIGDIILPPEREMRLWMRKHIATGEMPASALEITITSIEQAKADKRGPWLLVRGIAQDSKPFNWHINARPHTLWPVIKRAEVAR